MANRHYALYRKYDNQLVGAVSGLISPVISFLERETNEDYKSRIISVSKAKRIRNSIAEKIPLPKLEAIFSKK
jgi:hypothetical protein|tara:strand:+ start:209 stop:427 length:219 start_codon:yes stop_codon:yes gene_type:complete